MDPKLLNFGIVHFSWVPFLLKNNKMLDQVNVSIYCRFTITISLHIADMEIRKGAALEGISDFIHSAFFRIAYG